MTVKRGAFALLLFAVVVLVVGALPITPATAGPSTSTLPARLADREFWQLSEAFSEEGGTFHSDNFVSNEGRFQSVIPDLVRRAKPGGFYIGVGPEQNFTYMAALRPRMAFIVDIRRGNLQEHLLYKALFEMSSDRAEFLSRLFSRTRPAGLSASSTVEQLFAAYDTVVPTEATYRSNLAAVTAWLTKTHTFALHPEDITGIGFVYRGAFFADGPELNYQLTGQGRAGRGAGGTPSYASLMSLDDGKGKQWSYLSSEANFAAIKDLETKNLIVPVVGDFGGPKALRAVGRYADANGTVVAAFYLSNVEQYLEMDGKMPAFCQNVATFPLDASSTFIRSFRGGGGGIGMFTSSLANMESETRTCHAAVAR